MNHDQLFKELLTTFFYEFLELFAPSLSAQVRPESLQFLDPQSFTELGSGTRSEADLVVQAELRRESLVFLVHVEHQAQPQGHFAARMFRYYTQLRVRFGVPVYPIALFSYARPERPEPEEYTESFLGRQTLHFRYQVIQLNRLDWRDYLRHSNPVACALMSRMQFPVADRPRVKLQCLRLLATLRLDRARSHLISGFVDAYLRLSRAEERQFRQAARELGLEEERAVLKLTTSWKEEGRAEGKAEGKVEGRLEERRRYSLAMLPRLFGPDGAQLAETLQKHATPEQLEAVAEALLQGADLEALRSLLRP